MNRPRHMEDSKDGNQTLKEIDDIAKQYDSSTILASSRGSTVPNQQGTKKCCSSCRIF